MSCKTLKIEEMWTIKFDSLSSKEYVNFTMLFALNTTSGTTDTSEFG